MTTKVIKKVPTNVTLINVSKEEIAKNPRTEFQMRVYAAIQKIPKGTLTLRMLFFF